jgi:co-chaperonin GroES (HSP10)
MNILRDQINGITIDHFVSTSGMYHCKLVQSYAPYMGIAGEATMKVWHLVALNQRGQVCKVVVMGTDADEKGAKDNWEGLKALFTAKREEEEEQPDTFTTEKMPFHNCNISQGELSMLKINPIGSRVFVRDIQPVDEVTAKAEAAGVIVVIAEQNKPKPSMAIVLKVGNDPFIQELCQPGDIVMFSKHAGSTFMEAGQEYRSLNDTEIIGVRKPGDDDMMEDLGLKNKETVQ